MKSYIETVHFVSLVIQFVALYYAYLSRKLIPPEFKALDFVILAIFVQFLRRLMNFLVSYAPRLSVFNVFLDPALGLLISILIFIAFREIYQGLVSAQRKEQVKTADITDIR
ncbi:MAG: hypothetical protein QMD66_04735 [Actinomycetota bacterium]|nr:hypothetical protein [Actinomycetota bacterium]